jgi:predicted metal-dependent hydrolase
VCSSDLVACRDVKYPRLEFKTGRLLVIIPRGHGGHVTGILEKHRRWIQARRDQIKAALREARDKKLMLTRTESLFRKQVVRLVKRFSEKLRVKPKQIIFRQMRSKWGSCSAKRNLAFNRLLRLLPTRLIEYVVLHEVAHLCYRRHCPRFWKVLQTAHMDCTRREKELLGYWMRLQGRFC